ncbi:MAG TPA: class I adenylate-forming enzyme family protein [Acidimicrobiales bacterium]|nr:class I adenylate-forming enzyme family protein [Acidimicrobiales bacterium]
MNTAAEARDEPPDNLASLLIDHPFTSDEPLLCTVDHIVTAGEARSKARQLAGELKGRGVSPGQGVAVQLPNGPEVVVAMMAIWLAEAVFIPLNPRLPAAEVENVIDMTAPAAVINGHGIETVPDPRRYAEGAAFVLWTSGTTGRPKPILHSHTAYLELLDRMLGPLRSGDRRGERRPTPNLIPVSLALNAGIYNVLFGLRAGAAIVIMQGFETTAFAELVARFEIRSTVLPPAAMAMLNDDPSITTLSPLKYVRSITSPLSPLQARRFTERFGAFVLNSYGQAELGEVIGWTAADAKAHPEKLGAAGRPHPGVALKVVGEDGTLLRPGEVGQLMIRPPKMAIGYASGTELRDRLDHEGYLATGDLARVDEDDFVWIEGRAGDLINRGGNKIFPGEVEEVLRLAPMVTEAAVVPVPDERLGDIPIAFVVSETAIDSSELDALCRTHLVPYKVPVEYVRVDALPRNEAGKLLRTELIAQHTRTPS